MEVSEEQKRRIEANRAAAVARRNAKRQPPVSIEPSSCVRSWAPLIAQNRNTSITSASVDCRPCPDPANRLRSAQPSVKENHDRTLSLASGLASPRGSWDAPENQLVINACDRAGERVKVALEICAPDKFILVVKTGRVVILTDFFASISSVARCANLEPAAPWPVYDLRDYEKVTEALKRCPGVDYERIPWPTRMVLEKYQRGAPCASHHVTDSEVERLLLNLPRSLATTLLPFQMEGVRFGLQRGGRCLLADEMGVGKTIQAIAMASCYREEGSLLVVCPASMRLVWAEELERWLPYLSPLDVHLVFGRKNNLTETMQLPKVVVISFNMLARLRESMSSRKWGMIIVDEAHNLRCTTKKLECHETMAVLELAQNMKRAVLLTGTPSLSRPFDIFNQINCLWPNLLGKNKYEFARNYCDRQWPASGQGNCKDYSRGSRLLELNVLLKQTVMIRRLKNDVMLQLPPKRRQIICLQLSPADVNEARAFTATAARERVTGQPGEEACKCGFTLKGACECEDEEYGDESNSSSDGECEQGDGSSSAKGYSRMLSEQEIGVAKLRGFQEWLLNNSVFAGREAPDGTAVQKKMIVFAHHLKVLNSVQTIVQSKGVDFVRIDGSTLPRDRLNNVNRFRSDPEVKLAIVGVQAGGVGLDFSAAQSVAFVELPKSASEMLQAEDRAHRRGQKRSVNIYIFVAKGTTDVTRWQSLSKSLERVSTMTDGAEASLEIVRVVDSANAHLQAILSQDSCVTTETATNHAPACERLSTWDASAATSVNFPASSLMFEVSANTGRVHLFLRSSDGSAAPASLQANFKPEDLAHFAESGVCERGALPACLALNASHREAATSFWDEYSRMRPVFRKRLRGRPLSLPLSAELSASFKDEDQHVPGGVVKGGSKRRWTPKEEVGCEIPAGASWRTVSFHRRNGLKETKIAQAWTAADVPLCKYCQQPCKGPRSVKPEFFEDLFCQIACLNEYSNKTSRRHIREELFDLEGGVCVKCGLDCHALVDRIKPLPAQLRRAYVLENAPQLTECKPMLERLIKDPLEGNAWHADHIVAVADGGGECTMENFQTLCIACHAKVTAEQHRRRTSEKLKLKKSLQRTIKRLQEQAKLSKRRRTLHTEGVTDVMDTSEDEDDQDLLSIKVAGSAYSTSGGSGIAEVLTVRACESTLQPPSEGDLDLLNTKVAGSAYPTFGDSGITKVLTVRACESILQPASVRSPSPEVRASSTEVVHTDDACKQRRLQQYKGDLDLLNMTVADSANSFFRGSGVTEVLTGHACESILQPPSNSPEVRASGTEVVHTEDACKQPRLQQPCGRDSRESTRSVRSSPYFPTSGKKPTFSLQSLNKYLMGSV